MYKLNYSILILVLLCLINYSNSQTISSDGSCGPATNTKCVSGFCCSQYGYCGNTPDFCDPNQGCQDGYGSCGLNSTDSSNNNSNSPTISSDGSCGPTTNTKCGNGLCCSQYGYCGSTSDFCDPDQGCQTGYGSCGLNITNNSGINIIYTCQTPNTIALTFDDGPRSWTNTLLDTLDNNNIKATFFINGHNAPTNCIYDYAEIIQRAYSSGHLIAHHTWSHPYLTGVSDDEIQYQMDFLNTAFKKILGVTPRYFRPPYGDGVNDQSVINAMIANGMDKMVIWDVDTQDSTGITERAAQKNFISGIQDHPNPHIVISHDRIETSVNKLAPFEISKASSFGYQFDTVAGCTGDSNQDDWYNVDTGSFGTKDDTWICTDDDMHNSFDTSPASSRK